MGSSLAGRSAANPLAPVMQLSQSNGTISHNTRVAIILLRNYTHKCGQKCEISRAKEKDQMSALLSQPQGLLFNSWLYIHYGINITFHLHYPRPMKHFA